MSKPGAPYTVVDVGPSQGLPDWLKVATSKRVDAVWLKATEGASGRGSVVETFPQNAARVVAAGLPLGCYHFLSTLSEARAQADHFLETIDGCGYDLAPMVDVERGGPHGQFPSVDCLLQFLELVEEEVGCPLLIYTGQWVAEKIGLAERPEVRTRPTNPTSTVPWTRPLWVAAYTVRPPQFAPWGSWDKADGGVLAWQHTGSGEVPGISVSVDVSAFKTLPRLTP